MNYTSSMRPRQNAAGYFMPNSNGMYSPHSMNHLDLSLDNRYNYPYSYPLCAIPGMSPPIMPHNMPMGQMPLVVDSPGNDAYNMPMSEWDTTPSRSYQGVANRPIASFSRGSDNSVREMPLPDDGHLYGPGPPIITGARVRGPRGANLFCFHLPNEMTNWDLYLLFRRFGTILSVHTMINKQTGLSRGFGFVSFQEPHAADEAMKCMNGYRIGSKRLKVQHKRDKDDYDPEDDAGATDPDEHYEDQECTPYSSYSPSLCYDSQASTPFRSPAVSAPPTPLPCNSCRRLSHADNKSATSPVSSSAQQLAQLRLEDDTPISAVVDSCRPPVSPAGGGGSSGTGTGTGEDPTIGAPKEELVEVKKCDLSDKSANSAFTNVSKKDCDVASENDSPQQI